MSKILIVYYSLFNNTQRLAIEIAKQTGGDLREIIPEKQYSFDYNTASKEVRDEINRGYCPKLKVGNEPIERYDTIFIGSPNWFKRIAPPIMSFLRMFDFSGKTIIPFCTHGGGGFGQIETDISRECINAKILHGFAANGMISTEKVSDWLEDIKYNS
jgi:flavodoxin